MGRIREFKGHSVNRHVDNYCVLDLETTGVFIYSAEIIEISALKVRNNEVVEEFSTLVNPRCHIPEDATAVNHITDEMVREAPVIEDIIDYFLEFVNDDIILGYNNAGFDMCLIYDTVQELKNIPFSNDYIDILHAVRRSLPELENSKLETASKHYGFDTQGEHRALKDCYLTKDCYDKLFEEFGDIAFQSRRRSSSGQGVHYSNETLALQELNTLLKGILEDGKVSIIEMDLISDWIGNHRDLSGNYPFDKAFDALDRVLEDGVVTEQELTDLKTIFEEIIDPVRTKCCHDYIGALCGKSVCLTGEFEYGPKSAVEQLIVSADGTVDKTVKKVTSYLVVGAYGSNAWKAGNYGGKIQKAMYWNNKGQDIKIIEESDFIPAVLKLSDVNGR